MVVPNGCLLSAEREFNGSMNGSDKSKLDRDQNKFVVGATKRPDGTWDTSRAASFTDPKLAANNAASDAAKEIAGAEAWKKTMEVPADVKPGTASMVWDKLRRSIAMNQKTLNENPNGADSERLKGRIESFKIQQNIIQSIMLSRSGSEISALEMQGLVGEFIKLLLEVLKRDKEDFIARGGKSEKYQDNRSYVILDRERDLKEAEDLVTKMAKEAVSAKQTQV